MYWSNCMKASTGVREPRRMSTSLPSGLTNAHAGTGLARSRYLAARGALAERGLIQIEHAGMFELQIIGFEMALLGARPGRRERHECAEQRRAWPHAGLFAGRLRAVAVRGAARASFEVVERRGLQLRGGSCTVDIHVFGRDVMDALPTRGSASS